MKKFILIVGFLILNMYIFADVFVVVNKDLNTGTLTEKEIVKIFFAKDTKFPSGEIAVPIDQKNENTAYIDFIKKVLKSDISQMKAYWAKRLFTGMGKPPKQVENDQEVIQLVSKNQNVIGYVSERPDSKDVKIILEIK